MIAEYQYRMRPDWVETWGPWTKCEEDNYREHQRSPLVHDWHYEVRALAVVTPAPAVGTSPKSAAQLDEWERSGELKARAFGALREQEQEIGRLRDALAAVGTSVQPVLASLSDEQWYDLASRHATRDWNSEGYLDSVKALVIDALASSTTTKGGEAS